MCFQCMRTAFVWLALLPATIFTASAAYAQSVNLVAAGSLNLVLGQVADAFTAKTGITVTQTYSPSGTLRQQIEGGLRADVFASADTASPEALEQEGLSGSVQVFAYNQIVGVVRTGFGQTVGSSNLLSVLLDPSTRIGTSTPVADPLGDYTQQIFQKADGIVPGAAATLEGKRDELVANPNAPAVPAGANSLVYFLDTTKTVDIFIVYITSAVQATALDPTLQIVVLPRELTVPAPFGLTVLNGASSDGQQFANYILSPPGQRTLASYGFTPVCLPKVRGDGRIQYPCPQIQSSE
jgi:molybdate transport system substrate-binding protein